jgi:hypothetical protein
MLRPVKVVVRVQFYAMAPPEGDLGDAWADHVTDAIENALTTMIHLRGDLNIADGSVSLPTWQEYSDDD